MQGKSKDFNKIYTGIFGLWAWGDWGTALKIVKDNGFDIAVGANSKTILDQAHALRLKCTVDFGLTKEIAEDKKKWQNFLNDLSTKVTELKDHPAVFAWYFVDEPDWQNIPIKKIEQIVNLIKSIDKTKPIFTVLTIPDRWNAYLPYFDIISINPYLQNKSDGNYEKPEKVREWIKKLRYDLNKLDIKKPLWVVLGAFEMKFKTAFQHKTPLFKKPTPEEFNEMVKIAISEKVEGILVFALSMGETSQYKDWRLPEDDTALWEAVRNIPHVVKNTQQ